MLWFWVWTLLVVGTLVGAFFLGRRLYRSGRALVEEAGRAAELASVLSERVTELEAVEQQHPVRPVRIGDRDAARDRWVEAGEIRERRRERRRTRFRATYERWRSFSR
ncbi:hypothetical protein [Actinotalea sp.]|uniref:hypothetical protein n=1 Tax=Actinotalea sp. TaxID=1872145 RepID=UPI003562C55A